MMGSGEKCEMCGLNLVEDLSFECVFCGRKLCVSCTIIRDDAFLKEDETIQYHLITSCKECFKPINTKKEILKKIIDREW